MSVLLDFPEFISAEPRYIDKGGVLSSPLGADQRLNRQGNRYAVDYAVDFDTDEEFRRFRQKLMRAQTQGALVRFPQVGIAIGNPGTPLVDGAHASGTTLSVKGLTPYHMVKEGQFLSLIVSGTRFLHSVDEDAQASVTRTVDLTINPALRTALAGNEVVEMIKPMIEGFIIGDGVQWAHAASSHEPFIFSVRERR